MQWPDDASEASKKAATKRYESIRKVDQDRKGKSAQKSAAIEYHQLAGVCMDKPCSLFDIPFFEDVLDVNVVVFAAHLNNQVIYPDVHCQRRSKRVYITQKDQMVYNNLTVLQK